MKPDRRLCWILAGAWILSVAAVGVVLALAEAPGSSAAAYADGRWRYLANVGVLFAGFAAAFAYMGWKRLRPSPLLSGLHWLGCTGGALLIAGSTRAVLDATAVGTGEPDAAMTTVAALMTAGGVLFFVGVAAAAFLLIDLALQGVRNARARGG